MNSIFGRGADGDEQLLHDLDEALRTAREVPTRFVQAGQAAFAWYNIDAELAELTNDSALDNALTAGTRAEPASVRALTFVASQLTIEVEVTPDALLGQVVPPQSGEIELLGRDGSARTLPIDDVGWFVIRPVPTGLFRLHVRTADAAAVTEWITLKHAGN